MPCQADANLANQNIPTKSRVCHTLPHSQVQNLQAQLNHEPSNVMSVTDWDPVILMLRWEVLRQARAPEHPRARRRVPCPPSLGRDPLLPLHQQTLHWAPMLARRSPQLQRRCLEFLARKCPRAPPLAPWLGCQARRAPDQARRPARRWQRAPPRRRYLRSGSIGCGTRPSRDHVMRYTAPKKSSDRSTLPSGSSARSTGRP